MTAIAPYRKSLIAGVGMVVTVVQFLVPAWGGTRLLAGAAAALTWALVHWVPNAPSSSSPSSPGPAEIAAALEAISAELAKPVGSSSATRAPSSPSSSSA